MCGYCVGHGCSNQNIVDDNEEEDGDMDQFTPEVDEMNDDESQPPHKRQRK